MYCHVALLSPPYGVLTYAYPAYLPGEIWKVGMRVAIPLGRGVRVGIITKLDAEPPKNITMKDIVWCMELVPLLSNEYMDMIHQLALRQLTTVGRILGNVIPINMRITKNIRIRQFLSHGKPKLFTMPEIASMTASEQNQLGIAFMTGDDTHIQILADDPASSERVALLVDAPWDIRGGAVKQRAILDYLEERGSVSRRQLFKELPQHTPAFNTLIENGMIGIRVFEESDVQDDTMHQDFLPPAMPLFKLNEKQQNIFDKLAPHVEGFDNPQKNAKNSLLYGVTGSGKTAIYLDLAKHCMAQGKSAMILAPEVAIAFKLRNDAMLRHLPVSLYHGYQPPRIREKIFRENSSANNVTPRLIIGTRSALFLPIMNLGLIILDEEHDDSFKQDEGINYHAKDIAWYRIKKANGLLLMGSATPDVKTFYASENSDYERFEMKERFGNATLPDIHLIDIKGCKNSLAPESILALKECIKQGNQAMIMLNRRGFAPVMYCLDCKKTARCPHCDISLAYHKKKQKLVCHYCGYNLPVSTPCSHCNSIHFLPLGEGTERLEEEISALMNTPTNPVQILRLDRDSTRREGRMEEILNSFAKQEAQILIGTQMLSKGHHFPHVSLVIIADADLGLNFPDYRAAERTFQLLTQAAGRAGRGEKKGTVLIQTRDTTHYCWDFIRNNCYDEFYAHEIRLREKRQYPPFVRLALIRVSFDRNQAPTLWHEFMERIKNTAKNTNMKVLGPSPAPIAFLQGRLRFMALIKGQNWQEIRTLYVQSLPPSDLCKKHAMKFSLDIDPINML